MSSNIHLELKRIVRDDQLVDDLAAVVRIEDRVLYKADWGESASGLTRILTDGEVTILGTRGNGPWLFRPRFNGHTALTEFCNRRQDEAIKLHVECIYTLTGSEPDVYNFDIVDE